MGDHQTWTWEHGLTPEQEANAGLMQPRTILLTMGSDGMWSLKDEGMRGVLNAFTSAQNALDHALTVRPDEGVWA